MILSPKDFDIILNDRQSKRTEKTNHKVEHMLNLYLTPLHHPTYQPSAQQIQTLKEFLIFQQIIHPNPIEKDRLFSFSSGLESKQLFNDDAIDALLPAELTFEKLEMIQSEKPLFLPRSREVPFELACKQCHDSIETSDFYQALEQYEKYLSLDMMQYPFTIECISCQMNLTAKQIEFNQDVAWSSAWILIEEICSTRHNQRLIKEIGRIWGHELGVIPEHIEDAMDDFHEDFQWIKPSRVSRKNKWKKSSHR